MALDRSKYPGFDPKARHEFGRVHLPVAPKCNIQCNYCDRQYDCCNESCPGVTSTVLIPKQALEYHKQGRQRVPDLAVVGIAGPGDRCQRLGDDGNAHADSPGGSGRLLCVATNGLMVGPHLDGLAELKVSHVTVTINAVDPFIGQRSMPDARGTRVSAAWKPPGSRWAGNSRPARPQGTGITVKSQHDPDFRRQRIRCAQDRPNHGGPGG